MRVVKRQVAVFAASAFIAAAFAIPFAATAAEQDGRVVSIGGAVTEIIYELGQDHRLVARDTTSVYPAEALALPDVGYMRRLSPEGVLSVNPDLILTEPGSGPQETLDILAEAQIELVQVPGDYSAEGILERIAAVSEALGVEEAGAALAERVAADLAEAQTVAQARVTGEPPRVMFILSMTGGRINASGTDTRADGIITMAGGVNALSDFSQYRILSDEAIITAAPDVILMVDRSGNGDHATEDEELWSHPAIALTPAARNRALIRMDGAFLLSFGPRTAEAILVLAEHLHGR
jgi:iron complex transport system substrate-binding protein